VSGEHAAHLGRNARRHHLLPRAASRLARRIWHARESWWEYAVAVLLVVLALGAAIGLEPYVEDAPSALFLTAVALSAWRGGLGPALLATGVSALAVDYFFEEPRHMLEVTEPDTLLSLGLFLLLALLLGSANARLRDARDRASAAVRAREELLAGVSHDLRDPLGTIRLGAQTASILLDDARIPDKQRHADAQEALKEVDDATTRVDGFVQELLDLGRLEMEGRVALNREETDLAEVVRATVRAQALAGHQIRVSVPSTPIVSNWDTLRLRRVVDNLLSNAVKYSPNNKAEIHVMVALKPGWAELRVQDHGVGIPADQLPHVLEPFFRGSNVQGQMRGTGLGLYSARQIVEQHGGRLIVASKEGVGTTVVVRLPLDTYSDGLTLRPARAESVTTTSR
jgi:K+-sensing histidine kinase KdpD